MFQPLEQLLKPKLFKEFGVIILNLLDWIRKLRTTGSSHNFYKLQSEWCLVNDTRPATLIRTPAWRAWRNLPLCLAYEWTEARFAMARVVARGAWWFKIAEHLYCVTIPGLPVHLPVQLYDTCVIEIGLRFLMKKYDRENGNLVQQNKKVKKVKRWKWGNHNNALISTISSRDHDTTKLQHLKVKKETAKAQKYSRGLVGWGARRVVSSFRGARFTKRSPLIDREPYRPIWKQRHPHLPSNSSSS